MACGFSGQCGQSVSSDSESVGYLYVVGNLPELVIRLLSLPPTGGTLAVSLRPSLFHRFVLVLQLRFAATPPSSGPILFVLQHHHFTIKTNQ